MPDIDPEDVIKINSKRPFRSEAELKEYLQRQFEMAKSRFQSLRQYVDRLTFNPTKLAAAAIGFANTGRKLGNGYTKLMVAFGLEEGSGFSRLYLRELSELGALGTSMVLLLLPGERPSNGMKL